MNRKEEEKNVWNECAINWPLATLGTSSTHNKKVRSQFLYRNYLYLCFERNCNSDSNCKIDKNPKQNEHGAICIVEWTVKQKKIKTDIHSGWRKK